MKTLNRTSKNVMKFASLLSCGLRNMNLQKKLVSVAQHKYKSIFTL